MSRHLGWISPLLTVVAMLALLPWASAHPLAPTAGHAPLVSVPSPLHGTVVNCTTRVTCVFAFKSTAGPGWANATDTYAAGLRMALELPKETKISSNLSYSTYIGSLIGTYTYWTVGTFMGTDVNTGFVVYGTTDTNYTITCHGHSGRGGGCTYTYTTDNGTIVVHFTRAEITSTAFSCTPTSTVPQGKVTCSVTVTNGWKATNYPNGTVRISTGGSGTLSDKGACKLSKGTCKFYYYPSDNACGSVVLTGTYPGNTWYYRSSASITLDVVVSGGC